MHPPVTRPRLTRESRIPPGSTPEADPNSDAIVYLYSDGSRYCGVAFVGRASKPRWHYAFGTEASRRAEIDRLFAERRRAKEARSVRSRAHSLRLGQILVSSWGYEQTNVQFYQVTRVLPASVEAREIASEQHEEPPGSMCGTCTPIAHSFIGEPKVYRADGTNFIRVRTYVRASPWDGSPRHWSSYG
jgi:hypothetical protein